MMMKITIIRFHLFMLTIITFLFQFQPLVSAADFRRLAKSNCTDRCGTIDIPFPFGTTENCYRNRSYLVTCRESSGTPTLFLENSTVEVFNITLTGQLKIMKLIAKTCYSQDGTPFPSISPSLNLAPFLTVNKTANRFTVVGCDSFGYISGWRLGGRYYSTGCIATCRSTSELEDGSCEGLGCCQITSIPTEVWNADLRMGSLRNHTAVAGFNNCTYGFIVEQSAFNFSRQSFSYLNGVQKLPMVVDWVIGQNETCESARMDPSSYACVSNNSNCYEPADTNGYRCRCKTGYHGNPYLDDGCQDTDECSSPDLNNCTHECVNSPGHYSCRCRTGYEGNGIGERGCLCPEGYRENGVLGGGCIIDESQRRRGESRIYKPIAGTLVGMIIAILAIWLVYLDLRRRKANKMKEVFFRRNGGPLLQEKLSAAGNIMPMSTDGQMSSNNGGARIFSSTELDHATNFFRSDMIIGEGGFGTVYKGFLQDKRIVAVKKSKEVDPNQIDQFINEVVVLSRVHHGNIVKLIGCCLETQVPHLVYEFISNGTLHDHLHNDSEKRLLDWDLRLKIAAETADVLSYLHSSASIPIIHRDVKSANILLDHNFEAKVSDFGASRLVPVEQTQISTMVQGTFGYLDPEYMQTNQLTEKSDVYSFGVVLLELITGMKTLSNDRPEEERSLTNLFLSRLQQGRLVEILDKTIVGNEENLEQVTEVAKLARVCLNVKGTERPSMKEVSMELEGLRLGGKHSWVKFEQDHVDKKKPLSVEVLDNFDSGNGNSYSTSIGYISFRDQAKLNGGR